MALVDLIQTRKAPVFVFGLGYVGLPLALEAAGAGFSVVGVDTNLERVEQIQGGSTGLPDVDDEVLRRRLRSGSFQAVVGSPELPRGAVVVICVATPLKDGLPDTSFMEGAAKQIAERLQADSLVVLESTTYPGTTEELLLPILESSGLKAGVEFFLGFSPERIDPGNPTFGLRNVPKVIGGINEQSSEAITAFYSSFIDTVIPVSSPRAAEMTKLLENTYRHVNIALANEMAILCHDLGIDVWEVIDAAATKPFGFHPFYPGPGWGGHCIPVDPAYLSWRVRQMGATARFVELAREFNEQMPKYIVDRISEVLNSQGKSLKGASILILGVAYKADVPDARESPALPIVERLRKAGAEVAYHDPLIPEFTKSGKTYLSKDLDDDLLKNTDLALIHTPHTGFDYERVVGLVGCVFDARNVVPKGPGVFKL